jgi:tetratricopeptide (TPR) repeat protein
MAHSSSSQSARNHIAVKVEQPVEGVAQYQAGIISPKGKSFNYFALPGDWTPASLSQILDDFRTGIPTDRYLTKREAEPNVLTPRQFGMQLFQMIFGDKADQLYRDSLRSAQSQGNNLPVRLDIKPASLARLPWEFLFDPQEATEAGYLCFGPETPVIRFFDKEPRKPTFDPPLRLLLVSANPEEAPTLNLQREYGVITQAIEPLMRQDKAQVAYLFGATIDSLSERIRNFRPHIVHFMGHGNVDRLMLEDGADLSSASLTINLRGDRSLRLVVLNACKAGGVVQKVSGAEARLGVARSLAQAGIPAIVAMQFSICDAAAIIFAQRFYELLAEERPVDEALTWARIAMQNKLSYGSLEWATPVLYMQTPDGHLLDDLLEPGRTTIGTEIETEEERIVSEVDWKAERRQALEEQLAIHYRNLRELEIQAAKYGSLDVPLRIGNQIKDIQAIIEQIQSELSTLAEEAASAQQKEEEKAGGQEEMTKRQPEPTPPPEEMQVKLEIYYQDGVRYFDQTEWEKAISFLQTVYDHNADYRDTARLLEIANEKLQEEEQVRRRSNRVEILFEQAEQHFKAGRWREALDLLQVIQNDDPAFRPDEVAQMMMDAGVDYQGELEDKAARLRMETLYKRAREAMAEPNWARAIYVLEEIERQSPGYQNVPELLREARRQRLLNEEYAQGQAAFERNDWDAAVLHFGKAHAVDNNYKDVSQMLEAAQREQTLDARYQEGLDFLATGRWREAMKALEGIPQDDLRHKEAPLARNYAQARLHMETEEWKVAVELLQPLASAGYRDAGDLFQTAQQEKRWATFFERGQQAMGARQWDEAIKDFQVVVGEEPGYKKGEAQRLLARAKKEAELQRLYDRAHRFLNSKHWAEAIPLLEQIPKDHPDYQDVPSLLDQARREKICFELYTQATGHANRGEWPQAIAAFEQLLVESPAGYRDAQKRLEAARRQSNLCEEYRAAEAAIERRDWSQALVLLERVVCEQADFLDAVALLNIARRQFRLKQLYDEGKGHMQARCWAEAIMALEELQPKLDSNEPLDRAYADTPDLLARARQEQELADTYQFAREAMAAEQWKEAIEALQTIEKTRPEYEDAASLLARARIERDFSRAFRAGRHAYDAENWEQAIDSFVQALSHKPNQDKAVEMLQEAERQRDIQQSMQNGQRYEAEGNWAEAAKAYRRVTDFDPYHPEAINKLSQAERQQRLSELMAQADQAIAAEDWDQAVGILEDVVQIDASYEDVGERLAHAKRQRQLADKYKQAQDNLEEGQLTYDRRKLEIAIDLFGQIERQEPGYKKADRQSKTTREALQLLDDYVHAERLFNAERWREAIEKFQEIATRRGNYRDTLTYLKQAKVNQEDKEHWDRADSLSQGSEPSEEDLQEAKGELERIIASGASIYVEKAKARIEEVETQLKQRITEQQAYLKARYEEATKHLKRQNWAEAVTAFDEIWHMQPDYEDVQTQLTNALEQQAEALRKAGQRKEATSVLRRLREFRTERSE